jgi:archaellum component FlaD/FlaE
MTPIEAISNVAKAYQDLVIVLLALADKTVGVPVGQVMTVDAKEAPAKETKKEVPKSKENSVKPAEKEITIEQVRGVFAEKRQAGFTAQVKAIMESFNANKLSAVKSEDYAAMMAAAKGVN